MGTSSRSHHGQRHHASMLSVQNVMMASCRDEDGNGKGDGLVTYLKEPSLELALQILHGAPLRNADSKPMSVTQACAAEGVRAI